MGKSLVIVESPAKAKTINRYLGDDFVVKSSVGHIRDLPTGANRTPSDPKDRAKQAAITRKMTPEEKVIHREKKAKAQLISSMGIDPENNWSAQYATLPGKEKVVAELKKLAKNADSIYLATDMDREGEAIAWHLTQVIGGDSSRYKRVVFNEITKKAIRGAFEAPGELNTHRVDAQQARRFLDRVVGFELSPLLWEKIARNLSAGRVQSVALRLLVEREHLIQAFIPEEFWEVSMLLLSSSDKSIKFALNRKKSDPLLKQDEANKIEALINNSSMEIYEVLKKPVKVKPKAPFITSTLQQAASTKLSFNVKRTMRVAQKLYEAGLITYMRTDGVQLGGEAIASIRQNIDQNFGKRYLPDAPRVYKTKAANAQEAHEAIRPTEIARHPNEMRAFLDHDQSRLYELIWKRAISSQMQSAELDQTSIDIGDAANSVTLRASGQVMVFDGFWGSYPMILLVFTHLMVGVIVLGLSFLIFDEFLRF